MARDDMQTMCLVIVCNLVCACGMLFEIGGKSSEMFFLVDWYIDNDINNKLLGN
jgi:hypothetical protein